MRAGKLLCLSKEVNACSILPLGVFQADLWGQNPAPPGAVVFCLEESDCNPTIHVTAGAWVGFLLLCREAAGYTFNCCHHLDPDKAVHWSNKGSQVPTLFEAGIEVLLLLLLLLLSSFQALITGFGLIGGGVIIHDMHVVNTFCPVLPEVSDKETPLQGDSLSFLFPPLMAQSV